MPADAVSEKMNIIYGGDAALQVKITGAWARFKLKDGKYSCQHLIGRSLLANGTIPQNELEALTMESNLCWIVQQVLENWIEYYIIINDIYMMFMKPTIFVLKFLITKQTTSNMLD